MLIVITGTPGTGKTTAGALLGKELGVPVLHLREFVEKNRELVCGADRKMRSLIVDTERLRKALEKEIAKFGSGKNRKLIIEGHLACEFPLDADYVFVLRCRPDVLEKRLRARKYPAAKIEENLMSEMLDYCSQNAGENYAKKKTGIFEIETAGAGARQTAEKMLAIVSGKKSAMKKERINYTAHLMKHLRLLPHGR